MTIIGRITWRSEAENFQARNGEYMTLQRIGAERDAIILNIIVTAFKDQVAMLTSINENMLVAADVRFQAREWKQADGTARQNTEASLSCITPL
mgnify:CR=1 FL=1